MGFPLDHRQTEMNEKFPVWKRTLDMALVAITLPLWLPLMAMLAVVLKCASPGPLLYRQKRVGLGGRTFACLKFRSMKVNAQTQVHEDYLKRLIDTNCPMTKLDAAGDSRLIPMGRFFRSTGLDELPQIFNVIQGQMSLVGPRPCTPHEFSSAPELLSPRVAVPPGITGYWQVNGKNKTTFRRMLEMDEFYANHLSLALDLKILFWTAPSILGQIFESRGRCPEEKQVVN